MLRSFYFALSAHPAFIEPIDELNAIVLRMLSVHNSQFQHLKMNENESEYLAAGRVNAQ